MSTFNLQGHKVWFRETGKGEPIVFLHNGGNDHGIWEHQEAYFSRNHRVFVIDHLGHGESDHPDIEYTLPLFTEQVSNFVDQLGLAPVSLVGHCIGAAMALNYALQHPANVRKLVLFNVATEQTLLAGPRADVYLNFTDDYLAREEFIRAVETTGLTRQQVEESLLRQLGDGPAETSSAFADRLYRLYNNPGQMRTLYRIFSRFETYRVLDEIKKPAHFPPICLFWGSANKVLPRQGGERLRAAIQPDYCEFLEGCGHLAMREKLAEINQKIEMFLNGGDIANWSVSETGAA